MMNNEKKRIFELHRDLHRTVIEAQKQYPKYNSLFTVDTNEKSFVIKIAGYYTISVYKNFKTETFDIFAYYGENLIKERRCTKLGFEGYLLREYIKFVMELIETGKVPETISLSVKEEETISEDDFKKTFGVLEPIPF